MSTRDTLDWDLTRDDKASLDDQVQAAALAARALNYLTIGMREAGHMKDELDAAIVESYTGYLDALLTGCSARMKKTVG